MQLNAKCMKIKILLDSTTFTDFFYKHFLFFYILDNDFLMNTSVEFFIDTSFV